MATVTIATLRTRVRSRADMVNSDFVSDSEIDTWLTEAAQQLHDTLTSKFGEEYTMSVYTTNTVAGTPSYALPAGFYKLLAAEIVVSGQARDLKRFMLKDRTRYQNATTTGAYTPRYALQGSNIVLYPAPSAVTVLNLYYVPELPTPLVSTAFPNGWEQFVVLDTAIKCLQKEESDTSALEREKNALMQRIEQASENRDAGTPASAVDTEELDPDFKGWL